MTLSFAPEQWALILGGSSGFGLAAAKKLARHGMSIAIVHRDRRGAMAAIEEQFSALRAFGGELVSFNLDALTSAGRNAVLDELGGRLAGRGSVRLLLHSIAYGNLKLLAPAPSELTKSAQRSQAKLAAALSLSEHTLAIALEQAFRAGAPALSRLLPASYDDSALLDEEDFARTVHAMGTSLALWAQALRARGLFAKSARVIGLTSEGNAVAWRGYAAVSAAKAALEAVVRSLAVELAPYGVRTNVLQPGVTETPALALIPGSEQMKSAALLRNPLGRLTTPEDVADVIALLCTDEAAWINGARIRVDGGERIGA